MTVGALTEVIDERARGLHLAVVVPTGMRVAQIIVEAGRRGRLLNMVGLMPPWMARWGGSNDPRRQ